MADSAHPFLTWPHPPWETRATPPLELGGACYRYFVCGIMPLGEPPACVPYFYPLLGGYDSFEAAEQVRRKILYLRDTVVLPLPQAIVGG